MSLIKKNFVSGIVFLVAIVVSITVFIINKINTKEVYEYADEIDKICITAIYDDVFKSLAYCQVDVDEADYSFFINLLMNASNQRYMRQVWRPFLYFRLAEDTNIEFRIDKGNEKYMIQVYHDNKQLVSRILAGSFSEVVGRIIDKYK
ncbi:MAG TPA: hypothetical protein DCX65_00540 [Spirochaetaceae bacterium]|nr:hypothetical protein [Spirochaetaceae bacterium]